MSISFIIVASAVIEETAIAWVGDDSNVYLTDEITDGDNNYLIV